MIYIFLCLVIFARISNSNKILPTSNLKSPDYFNVSLDQSKSNNVFFTDQDEIRFLAIGDWGSGKKGKKMFQLLEVIHYVVHTFQSSFCQSKSL